MKNNSNSEDTNDFKDLIYIVRGVQVMLDSDLAGIYGYTTSAFNQQVRNNIKKFDDDFRFQLTKKEYEEILKSKILISKIDVTNYESDKNKTSSNLKSKNLISSWGGSRRLPYVFTEQGIYMLMTVLKGELATRQTKTLIRTFKEMKDFSEKGDCPQLHIFQRIRKVVTEFGINVTSNFESLIFPKSDSDQCSPSANWPLVRICFTEPFILNSDRSKVRGFS